LLDRAATTVASMAIDQPEATGQAPACRPERSEGRQGRNFLGARGMTAQPSGEESCGTPSRQPGEAQPIFG